MTREEAIEQLIEATRDWRESKRWAEKNAKKLLTSDMSSEDASEVVNHYFDKEIKLIDAINVLDDIDGQENVNATKKALEDL